MKQPSIIMNNQRILSVIDTATREVIKTLVTGDGSFFSAINPNGTKFVGSTPLTWHLVRNPRKEVLANAGFGMDVEIN